MRRGYLALALMLAVLFSISNKPARSDFLRWNMKLKDEMSPLRQIGQLIFAVALPRDDMAPAASQPSIRAGCTRRA